MTIAPNRRAHGGQTVAEGRWHPDVGEDVDDGKMPDFNRACSYAASQGWLIVEDDTLTLSRARLAAA